MKRKSDREMVKILMIVLIAFTFFSAVVIDHDLIFIAQVDYGVISNFMGQHPVYRIIWVLSVIAQIAIIRTYFLIGKSNFGSIVTIAPLVYLICKIFLFTLFSIVLVPFLMLWIWILFASHSLLEFRKQRI